MTTPGGRVSSSEFKDIHATREDLFIRLSELRDEGARFITTTTLDRGDDLEIVYHFERGDDVLNLHLRTPKNEPMPSITGIYPMSFFAENEIQDHFNLDISGINIDFGGHLFRVEGAEENTLLKPSVGPVPFIKRFYGRCREACPAMVNAPKYIRQILEDDPEGGYSTVIESAPLPAVLGRVCFAPCEEGCRQERNDEPIRIRLLKRYTADASQSLRRDVTRMPSTGKSVAVVGGGPSGISCAFYLGMLGHSVTIFEREERCGGAMLWGIPKYRLPKDLLGREIKARLEEAGVELRTGIDVDDLDPLMEAYDAVYVGIGAGGSYNLWIEGEDSEGVLDFRDLLTAVNMEDKKLDIGDRVAIIGGGNSSIDAARVSRRLGASEVTLYYRRTAREMPASPHEVQGAAEEGVNFEYLSSPVSVIPGKPLGLVLQHMELGKPDASGRRRPVPIEGSQFTVEVDAVIEAIGQSTSVPEGFKLDVSRRGRIIINEDYETSRPGVWAGGDIVFGPSSVIEALRDGRDAASIIDRHFGGAGWQDPSLDMDEFVGRPLELSSIRFKETVDVRELPPDERIKSFNEVELGFNRAEALEEASRCWRCDWNE